LATIPVTCWLCAWLATPRRPLVGNEVQELVYGRLLGRQQRLVLLAIVATALVFLPLILLLPSTINPDLQDVRLAQTACHGIRPAGEPPSCYVLEPGGIWAVEEWWDGGWTPVEVLPTRPNLGPAPCTA